MAITSITIGGIDVFDGAVYAAGAEMAYALEAMATREPIAVEMADRHAFYVRDQIQPRQIPIVVYLLEPTLTAREAAFDALRTAWEAPGLITLTWQNGGSQTLDVHVQGLIGAQYYSRATAEAIAYDPIPR